MKVQPKRLIVISMIVIGLLTIPFVAMQYSEEVNWSPGDFGIMGSVLFAVGLTYELITQRSKKTVYKVAVAVGLMGAFLLFWVNGAVGIIGHEGQPANLLYGVVFLVGISGAIIARFKPEGMSRTLYAAAITQMLVPLIALTLWPPPSISWSPNVFGVFFFSAFFAILFVASAILFRHATKG